MADRAPSLSPAPDERTALLDELGAAVTAGEIVPWYQPIVELATGSVIGVEAFARRRHPDGRIDQPASFVPLAESTDLIIELDLAVIRQALDDLARWQLRRPDWRLNVNLSGRHLEPPARLAALIDAVTDAGVQPRTVCLEVTETARPRDIDHARALLADVRTLGFSVWFDDFGAGFYDLQDLATFPLDGVKIDRGLTELLDRPRARALIAGLAGALDREGVPVTLEGIETEHQATLARDLGCRYGQGFWWSRPAPAGGVPDWFSGYPVPGYRS